MAGPNPPAVVAAAVVTRRQPRYLGDAIESVLRQESSTTPRTSSATTRRLTGPLELALEGAAVVPPVDVRIGRQGVSVADARTIRHERRLVEPAALNRVHRRRGSERAAGRLVQRPHRGVSRYGGPVVTDPATCFPR